MPFYKSNTSGKIYNIPDAENERFLKQAGNSATLLSDEDLNNIEKDRADAKTEAAKAVNNDILHGGLLLPELQTDENGNPKMFDVVQTEPKKRFETVGEKYKLNPTDNETSDKKLDEDWFNEGDDVEVAPIPTAEDIRNSRIENERAAQRNATPGNFTLGTPKTSVPQQILVDQETSQAPKLQPFKDGENITGANNKLREKLEEDPTAILQRQINDGIERIGKENKENGAIAQQHADEYSKKMEKEPAFVQYLTRAGEGWERHQAGGYDPAAYMRNNGLTEEDIDNFQTNNIASSLYTRANLELNTAYKGDEDAFYKKFVKQGYDAVKGEWPTLVTLGITDAAEMAKLVTIANKVDKSGEESLTKAESNLYDAYTSLEAARLLRAEDKDWWAKAGQQLAEQIPFMVSLALGGGLTKAAAKKIGSTITKKLISKGVKGFVGKAAGATGRMILEGGRAIVEQPVNPLFYRSTAEHLLGVSPDDISFTSEGAKITGRSDKMDFADAVINGWIDAAKETWTERFAFSKAGGVLLKNIPGAKQLVRKISKTAIGNIAKTFANAPGTRIAKDIAFHGMFEEDLEELDGSVIDYARGDKDAIKKWASLETQVPMWISFGAMSGAFGVVNAAGYGTTRYKYSQANTRLDKTLTTAGYSADDIAKMKNSLLQTNMEDAGKAVKAMAFIISEDAAKAGNQVNGKYMEAIMASWLVHHTYYEAYSDKLRKEHAKQQFADPNDEAFNASFGNLNAAVQEIMDNTNPDTGNIETVTIGNGKDAREYVCTKGKLVLKDDGTIDEEKSDQEIFLKDENGKIETYTPQQITAMSMSMPAEQAVQETSEDTLAKEWTRGQAVIANMGNGTYMSGKVAGTNEDGDYLIYEEDTNQTIAVRPGQIMQNGIEQSFTPPQKCSFVGADGKQHNGVVIDPYSKFQQGTMTVKSQGSEEEIDVPIDAITSVGENAWENEGEVKNEEPGIENEEETNGIETPSETNDTEQTTSEPAPAETVEATPTTVTGASVQISEDDDSATTASNLTARFNGDEQKANRYIEAKIAAANDALKQAGKQKNTVNPDDIEAWEAEDARIADEVAMAQARVDYWTSVQGETTKQNTVAAEKEGEQTVDNRAENTSDSKEVAAEKTTGEIETKTDDQNNGSPVADKQKEPKAKLSVSRKTRAPRYAKENRALGESKSLREELLRLIATGIVRFRWKDSDTTKTKGLGAHLGWGEAERKKVISILSNENGDYPEVAAEKIYESLSDDLKHGVSDQDVFNELLDIVKTYGGRTSQMMDEAKQLHGSTQEGATDEKDDAYYEERQQAYEESQQAAANHMTVEEWRSYKEIDTNELFSLPSDDEMSEIYGNFAEYYKNLDKAMADDNAESGAIDTNNKQGGEQNEQGSRRNVGVSGGISSGQGLQGGELQGDGRSDTKGNSEEGTARQGISGRNTGTSQTIRDSDGVIHTEEVSGERSGAGKQDEVKGSNAQASKSYKNGSVIMLGNAADDLIDEYSIAKGNKASEEELDKIVEDSGVDLEREIGEREQGIEKLKNQIDKSRKDHEDKLTGIRERNAKSAETSQALQKEKAKLLGNPKTVEEADKAYGKLSAEDKANFDAITEQQKALPFEEERSLTLGLGEASLQLQQDALKQLREIKDRKNGGSAKDKAPFQAKSENSKKGVSIKTRSARFTEWDKTFGNINAQIAILSLIGGKTSKRAIAYLLKKKAAIVEKYIGEINDGHKVNVCATEEDFKKELSNYGNYVDQYEEARKKGCVVYGVAAPDGTILINSEFAKKLQDSDGLYGTFFHERQHVKNRTNGVYGTMGSVDRKSLAAVAKKLSNSDVYDDYETASLIDEAVAFALQEMYDGVKAEDLTDDRNLQNILKNLYNEQRQEEERRFGTSRNPAFGRTLVNRNDEGSRGQNGQDNEGESGNGSLGRNDERIAAQAGGGGALFQAVGSQRRFGGNSGYVGYSKSKRAVQAENSGLRNSSQMNKEFADEVNDLVAKTTSKPSNITLKQIKEALPKIKADEWHHTSMYGNKTNYYSAETIADYFTPESEEEKTRKQDYESAKAEYGKAVAEADKLVIDSLPLVEVDTAIGKRKAYKAKNGLYVEVNNNRNSDASRIFAIKELEGEEPFVISEYSEWAHEHSAEFNEALTEFNTLLAQARNKIPKELNNKIKELNDKIDNLEKVVPVPKNARFQAIGENDFEELSGAEAAKALQKIFDNGTNETLPNKISSINEFDKIFSKPIKSVLGEAIKVGKNVYNKLIRKQRGNVSGAIKPTIENADFVILDMDGSRVYVKLFNKANGEKTYNIAVVNKNNELEEYVSSVHIKTNNNLLNKIKKGAVLSLPSKRISYEDNASNNSTPNSNNKDKAKNTENQKESVKNDIRFQAGKDQNIVTDSKDDQLKINGDWWNKTVFGNEYKVGDYVPEIQREAVKEVDGRIYINPNNFSIQEIVSYGKALEKVGLSARRPIEWLDFIKSEGIKEETNRLRIKALKSSILKSKTSTKEDDSKFAKEFADKAKKHFGTTTNFDEAGYLLKDGTMLDFSEKNRGGRSGYRSLDHRGIAEIGSEMVEFMSYGNVRMKPEADGFEVTAPLTGEQSKKIKEYVRKLGGDVYVDFSRPGAEAPDFGFEYTGASADKIVADIDRFYNEGIKPTQRARFQVTAQQDADYMKAVEAGDMKAAQKMVDEVAEKALADSKVRDGNGKLKKVYHITDSKFTVFEAKKARQNSDIPAFFFSPNKEDWKDMGNRVVAAYLNITNPIEKPIANMQGSEVRKELERKGYDGTTATEDGEIVEYAAFYPNQIKSAEAVTHDDKGNVIPLSQRFNEKNRDIRFQAIREQDADYMKAVEVGDMETAQKMLDEVGGAATMRMQAIGEQGARALDRAEEATTRLDNLSVARDMEKAKKDAKSIKLATGWERGADNKWRYETNDFNITLRGDANIKRQQEKQPWYKELNDLTDKIIKGDDNYTKEEFARFSELVDQETEWEKSRPQIDRKFLEDYVVGDDIFKAYPQLKGVEIVFINDPKDGYAGKWSRKNNTIFINEAYDEPIKEVLIHEVQHAIQDIEGFAQGGNESIAYTNDGKGIIIKDKDKTIKELTDKQKKLYASFGSKEIALEAELVGMSVDEWKKDLSDRISKLNTAIANLKKQRENIVVLEKIEDKDAYEIYRRLSGEVESRNAERRSNMTDEQRRNSLMSETEDVAREDQIFINDGLGGGARFQAMGDGKSSFKKRQAEAETNRGTVMPDLANKEVVITNVPRHKYKGERILDQAVEAAKKRYNREIANKETGKVRYEPVLLPYSNNGVTFEYTITPNSLNEAAHKSSKSENLGVHVAVMDKLDEVIGNSIEYEEHPDVEKNKEGERVWSNNHNKDVLIHRFVGAITIDGKPYRVKTTIKEYLDNSTENKHYAYEVTKIEVLDENTPNTSNGAPAVKNGTMRTANLLKGVEKSYDKGKKILDESEYLTFVNKSGDVRFQAVGDAAPKQKDYASMNEWFEAYKDWAMYGGSPENMAASSSSRSSMQNSYSALRKEISTERGDVQANIKKAIDFARQALPKSMMSSADVKQLLTNVRNATTNWQLLKSMNKIYDVVLESQQKASRDSLDKLLKTKISKIDDNRIKKGVTLDADTIELFDLIKEYTKLDFTQVGLRLQDETSFLDDLIEQEMDARKNGEDTANITARKLSTVKKLKALEYVQNYLAEREAANLEISTAKSKLVEFADTKGNYLERRELINSINRAREDLIKAQDSFAKDISALITEGHSKLMDIADEKLKHKQEVQHVFFKDLVDKEHPKVINNGIGKISSINSIFGVLYTFHDMLLRFGGKATGGKGFAYKYFMPKVTKAYNDCYAGKEAANKKLDTKTAKLFGWKEGMRDAFGKMITKYSKQVVGIYNNQEHSTHVYADNGYKNKDRIKIITSNHFKRVMKGTPVTAGMVVTWRLWMRQEDGRVKLEQMGITEEALHEWEEQVAKKIGRQEAERLFALGDYIQKELLPELRTKYNAVYKKKYGVNLGFVRDYFPLKISAFAITEEVDINKIGQLLRDSIPGPLRSRTKNLKMLDMVDAFQLTLEHINEMERFSAYADLTEDFNIILSNRTFKSKLEEMQKGLYKMFLNSCLITLGLPFEQGGSGFEEWFSRLAKNATGANIAFRPWTAVKQTLSIPAFMVYTSPYFYERLVHNGINPKGSFDWAYENIPLFRERVDSRFAGNEKLANVKRTYTQWERLIDKGMWMNSKIDAITVAVGARTVYEEEYRSLIKRGYTEETAQTKAMNTAIIAWETSQQSSNGAYVSPIQSSKGIFEMGATVYQNSVFAYSRKTKNSFKELGKWLNPKRRNEMIETAKRMIVEDAQKGYYKDVLTDDEVERLAKSDVKDGAVKATLQLIVFGVALNTLWAMSGQLNKILTQILFSGDDDDDKSGLKDLALGSIRTGSMQSLLSMTTFGSYANTAISGFDASFGSNPFSSEIDYMYKTWKNGNGDKKQYLWELASFLTSNATGVDLKTISNMIFAIDKAVESGLATPDDVYATIALALNTPKGTIKAIELKKRPNETDEEYTLRQYRVDRIFRYGLQEIPFSRLEFEDVTPKDIKRFKSYLDRLNEERLFNKSRIIIDNIGQMKYLNEAPLPFESETYKDARDAAKEELKQKTEYNNFVKSVDDSDVIPRTQKRKIKEDKKKKMGLEKNGKIDQIDQQVKKIKALEKEAVKEPSTTNKDKVRDARNELIKMMATEN